MDEVYRQSYISHYNDFTHVSSFLVERKDIVTLYETFRENFPMCHSIFSIIVSSSRYCVQLASLFSNEDASTTPDVSAAGVGPDAEVEIPDDNTDSTEELLHCNGRSTLEYFLAMIRMKSQKQLVYWSMLSPLGHHSKGYMKPGRKNPLSGSQCTIKTAWKKLDEIFEECSPVLMTRIKQQFTCSAAFDNWQRSIAKMWQGGGKASVFQRGTAYFIK